MRLITPRATAWVLVLAMSMLGSLGIVGCRDAPGRTVAFEDVFVLERDILLQDDPDAPLGMPIQLVRWGDRFVIIDGMLANAKVFDRNGGLIHTIGRMGEGPGEFTRPLDAAELRDGSLAILDYGRNRVSVFDPAGDLVDEWPTPPGNFRSLDVTHDGRIVLGGYLTDEMASPTARTAHIVGPGGRLERSLLSRAGEWQFGERTFADVQLVTHGGIIGSFESASNRGRFVDLHADREWEAVVGEESYRGVDWSEPEVRAQDMEAATDWYHAQMWVLRALPLDDANMLVLFVGADVDSGEWSFTYALTDYDGSTKALIPTETQNSISYADDDGLFGIHVDDVGQTWIRVYSER